MTRSERLAHEQKRARDARPRVSVRSVQIEKAVAGKGYAVHIEGENLQQAIVVPRVTVGAEPVGELRFSGDGRWIFGTVVRKPRNRHTIVDYGFTKAEVQ
jgi:hypothetical protein